MKIDPIKNGIVIDHIEAGKGQMVYDFLGLGQTDCMVALIKNVPSKNMGKKDIIKIDANISVALDVLGYIAPEATVNIIKDGVLTEKKTIEMPLLLTNVIKCKNPRCISSCEQELDHVFKLTDKEKGIYRCLYCETQAKQ